MIRLFRLTHLPFWRQMRSQVVLPVCGIALGVAAVVAIDLGSANTVRSFRDTMERLEGRATHQIVSNTTLLGELAWELRQLPSVEAAAPVLETMSLAVEPLRLIGLDVFAETGLRALGLESLADSTAQTGLFLRFLAEPGALVVSAPYLRRQGLSPGDSLQIAVGSFERRAFVLSALPEQVGGLDVPDNLALCDIATAQELTGREDVSRIDLIVREPSAARLDALQARLPDGARLVEPGGRTERLSGMLAALRTNLEALSYLALFVSLFLIYNAMLLAVLRRRPQIGIVRCLGARRRDVLGAWLLEALIMGVLGTALGITLGWLGSRFAADGITQTANDLYGYVPGGSVRFLPATFGKAAVVGLLASVGAALLPAAEAAHTTPAHTAYRGEVEVSARRRRQTAPLLAIPLAIASVVCLRWPSESPIPGYAAAVALALAVALVTPSLGALLLRALRALFTRTAGLVATLAASNILASMSRSGVAMAALAIALSMSIAMSTMVQSFREELRSWIGEAVRADIYLSPVTAEVERTDVRLDPRLVEYLRQRDGVVAVDTYRGCDAEVDGVATFVAGIEVGVYRERSIPTMIDGPSGPEFLDLLQAGQAGITETLMRKTGLRAGDALRVRARGRDVALRVAGVYRDFSSDRGVVLMDRRHYEDHLGPQPAGSVALYLAEDRDVKAEVDRLKRDVAGTYAVVIYSNRSLREQAFLVFDRTFSVARTLEFLGIAVASIGILSALLAMLLERGRELASLRTLGLTPRQLDRMLLLESFLLVAIAWVIALAAGSALAWILLRVINLRSFGWSLPYHVPWQEWLIVLGFGLLAAAMATVYPVIRSRRLVLAEALRGE